MKATSQARKNARESKWHLTIGTPFREKESSKSAGSPHMESNDDFVVKDVAKRL